MEQCWVPKRSQMFSPNPSFEVLSPPAVRQWLPLGPFVTILYTIGFLRCFYGRPSAHLAPFRISFVFVLKDCCGLAGIDGCLVNLNLQRTNRVSLAQRKAAIVGVGSCIGYPPAWAAMTQTRFSGAAEGRHCGRCLLHCFSLHHGLH